MDFKGNPKHTNYPPADIINIPLQTPEIYDLHMLFKMNTLSTPEECYNTRTNNAI